MHGAADGTRSGGEPAAVARSRLGALLALYFAQGLPFGFQATALPLILRSRGVSLKAIGFASLLSAPWLGKALWAPLVDRYGFRGIGRRKSWILPMQAGLVATAVLAGRTEDPVLLVALVLAMNFFAATQDIAVDALAVSWLAQEQLGLGNATQVVGYKLGMLTGGGLLVWASARIGWRGSFEAMGLLLFAVFVLSVGIREERGGVSAAATRVDFRDIVRRLGQSLRHPATLPLVVVVLTYKMGETLVDVMWKPMLFDRGFSAASIGLWTGTYGMAFSLLGSTGAGLAVRRIALPAALAATALFRAAGVAGEWWLTATPGAGSAAVIAVTCVEHFVGGAITTVLFALMMRHTDRTIGATHYTLLASLEVWGKLPLAALSGVLATWLGYQGLFATGTALCVGFAAVVFWLRPRFARAFAV